jgi:hypothetical protein
MGTHQCRGENGDPCQAHGTPIGKKTASSARVKNMRGCSGKADRVIDRNMNFANDKLFSFTALINIFQSIDMWFLRQGRANETQHLAGK